MIKEISSRPVRFAIAMTALLALAACGDKDDDKKTDDTATETSSTEKPSSVRDVFAAAAGDSSEASRNLANPRVLVIDQGLVFEASKAGQDLFTKLEAIQKEISADQDKALEALAEEAKKLSQQRAILPSEDYRKKFDDLVQREDVTKRQFAREMQAAQAKGESQIMRRLTPILQQIMVEKGGTILMEKSDVLMSSDAFSVTDEAVKRLDEAMPTVEVERKTFEELSAEAKALQEARAKAQAEAEAANGSE